MEYLKNTFIYQDDNGFRLLMTVLFILSFVVIKSVIRTVIRKHAEVNGMVYSREVYVKKVINMILVLALTTFLGIIWNVSLRGISTYLVTIFTVVGVGLFANWSILSNMTASIILFFFYPYKIGSQVKILDGASTIEGEIVDITLFHIEIKTEDGENCSYPNSLAMSKPILHA